VETDFLFGLSAGDKLHRYVIRWLEGSRKGLFKLVVSGASPVEAAVAMLSKGFSAARAQEVLEAMSEELELYGAASFTELSLEVVARAMQLREKHEELGFFDSLHVAAAATSGAALLSSDAVVRVVAEREGLEALSLSDSASFDELLGRA